MVHKIVFMEFSMVHGFSHQKCKERLNLFWILVGASGTGKSQSRKRFITEPLEYILGNGRVQIPDFEISKFIMQV